jgi:DNA-binding transcriptional ArsR family regulator
MTALEGRPDAAGGGERRPVSERALEEATSLLGLLGDRTRALILLHLEQHGSCAVSEIHDAIGSSLANVSRHLSLLYKARLVERAKDGMHVRYTLRDWSALRLLDGSIACVIARAEEEREAHES